MQPTGSDAAGFETDEENRCEGKEEDGPEADVKRCEQNKGKDAGIDEEKPWLALCFPPVIDFVIHQSAFMLVGVSLCL